MPTGCWNYRLGLVYRYKFSTVSFTLFFSFFIFSSLSLSPPLSFLRLRVSPSASSDNFTTQPPFFVLQIPPQLKSRENYPSPLSVDITDSHPFTFCQLSFLFFLSQFSIPPLFSLALFTIIFTSSLTLHYIHIATNSPTLGKLNKTCM